MEAHRATACLSDPPAPPDAIAAPVPSSVVILQRPPFGVMAGDSCRRADVLGEASKSKSGSGSTLDKKAAWDVRASCRNTCLEEGGHTSITREGRGGEGF